MALRCADAIGKAWEIRESFGDRSAGGCSKGGRVVGDLLSSIASHIRRPVILVWRDVEGRVRVKEVA